MIIRFCPAITCGRPFQLNQFAATFSEAKDHGKITCPHCGPMVAGDNESVFLTHALSNDQETRLHNG
jgi:DNA-directed RNA polymerase subunit RPC12/RpoP